MRKRKRELQLFQIKRRRNGVLNVESENQDINVQLHDKEEDLFRTRKPRAQKRPNYSFFQRKLSRKKEAPSKTNIFHSFRLFNNFFQQNFCDYYHQFNLQELRTQEPLQETRRFSANNI